MIKSLLKFNGISSADLGLIIQFSPAYAYPDKEYETLHIPGRNGDLILDKGSFQNVERTYSLAKVFRPGQGFLASANSIVSWLHSSTGYARLEDSYEPEYYRMAVYKDSGEMNNYYDQATVIEVTFECKPQRWLISGEKIIDINSGDSIKNPTSFDASPVIMFTVASGQTATLTVGDVSVEFKNTTINSINLTLDCENMECYDAENNVLYNSYLTLINGKFPYLKGKETTEINYTNLTNVKIQPRWWTL